ncbi:ubiquitin carboxyl-terminal hydrolase 45 isoform X2 [Ornithorhynchus anatinus]|uniref:ubiquitin carboxyl-terminal hydrolase 45 isoform X2 n=1 Tax=Ornithorhynchus anatinus TaxID=9258 RepID=UPI0010A82856|nr:ubiquitin carboxyl-terminal hydrolase 45 isoform X2 [Ornithorhynchus anatinus]
MRVKAPSRAVPEKAKRNKRPNTPQDEDSSDDIAGLTCQHGCSQNSESQHSLKHSRTARAEPHCIVISLSTWIIWCYECNEELSTHCNKKVLAQIVDFLQKHVSKTEASSLSKVIRLREEKCEASEIWKGKYLVNSAPLSVKGINNLGNTCFFNAVMQNLAQTHKLNELMYEIKEKGAKLKIFHSSDTESDSLMVTLSSPGPLTSAMFLFLHSMKEAGKGPLSPKALFSQLCQKAPRFKGFQQQDSQELLHYLLDAMRTEETKRIQAGILKAFNNPTTKTADEETRKKVKAYGREGVKMNFIDRIFVGELTSTVMCEECENISTMKEPFLDLSLPIIEERVSKPVTWGRMSKCKTLQEAELGQYSCSAVTAVNHQQPKDPRKNSLTKDKNQLNQERRLTRIPSSGEEKIPALLNPRRETVGMNGGSGGPSILTPQDVHRAEAAANGSQTDCSEREVSHSEGSVDADSEASEWESVPKGAGGPHPLGEGRLHDSAVVAAALSQLSLGGFGPGGRPRDVSKNWPVAAEKGAPPPGPQHAFQSLSQSYTPASKECSVQSCLYQFTSVELLMGNNKLLCENCTEKTPAEHAKTYSSEKKPEGVYTNARKQLLISVVPAVLILHLKRFHQAGLSLRKVNRHVDFPLVLDLAPFSSVACKNAPGSGKVLYTLYGIVEHSGSMRGGHYTAYVKVRGPPKASLEHVAGIQNVQGLKEAMGACGGQWVYVSDTHVQMVPESRALSAQAYLLFYERML